MSYSMAITNPEKLCGAGILSGRKLSELDKSNLDKSAYSNLSMFISHGNHDRLLNFEGAKAMQTFATQKGIKVSFHEYDADHEIIEQNLKDFTQWVKVLLDAEK